jgi:Mg2+ and Co2+ transporter CorA
VHLIAEHDTLANQELAKDTRRLAVLALQDSAGIKALTIVATLFIPPTFVSSLLSIPLFDWGSGGIEPWMKRVLL